MESNSLVERKVRALSIRQRIESLATRLWSDFTGRAFDTLSHSQVVLRLHLLIGKAVEADRHATHGIVIALASAYRETSDLIHGRSKASRTPLLRFDEWEDLLHDAESIAKCEGR